MEIDLVVKHARAGDMAAERDLFHYLTVRFRLFVLYRIGAEPAMEDIVQDTIMTISQKYRTTDTGESFMAWAYAILENHLRHYFRTQKYNKSKLARLAREGGEAGYINSNPELKRRLLKCLQQICRANIRYARMLNFHYQGYTTEEICSKLKITRSHAYVIFSRAKAMLRTCLRKGSVD